MVVLVMVLVLSLGLDGVDGLNDVAVVVRVVLITVMLV